MGSITCDSCLYLTGEAAGLLAALAVEKEPTLEKLQTKLINRGNKIHY